MDFVDWRKASAQNDAHEETARNPLNIVVGA